jgi:hypothetical protein
MPTLTKTSTPGIYRRHTNGCGGLARKAVYTGSIPVGALSLSPANRAPDAGSPTLATPIQSRSLSDTRAVDATTSNAGAASLLSSQTVLGVVP